MGDVGRTDIQEIKSSESGSEMIKAMQ